MVAPEVPLQMWTVKHDAYLSWITQVNDNPDAALVHSMSSGDPETDVHPSTRRRVDTEFMKAGLRGITLAFSSGDSGPWDEDFQPEGGLFSANYVRAAAAFLLLRLSSIEFEIDFESPN